MKVSFFNCLFPNIETPKQKKEKGVGGYPAANKEKNQTDLNNSPLSIINQSLIKRRENKTQLLKPKAFSTVKKRNYIPSAPKQDVRNIYINVNPESGELTFREEFKPEKLPIIEDITECHFISNFALPHGTVSMQTNIDEAIGTNDLFQCVAVAFVDKNNKIQSLIHLCPTINKADNDALLEYHLSNLDKNNLEIGVVHGNDKVTDNTLIYLFDFLFRHCPEGKIKFYEFPNDEDTALILKNGELKCIDCFDINMISKNPKEKLIYASRKKI